MLAKVLSFKRKVVGGYGPRHPVAGQTTRTSSVSQLSDLEIFDAESDNRGKVIWTVFLLFFGSIVWMYFAHVDIYATAQGKLIPTGKVKTLQTLDQAIVKKIHVHEGDFVREGDLMVELDPTLNETELVASKDRLQTAKAEMARLESELYGHKPRYDTDGLTKEQLKLLETQRIGRVNFHESKLIEYNITLRSRSSSINSAMSALAQAKAQLATAEERQQRVQPYVGKIISRFEYLKMEDSVAQLLREVAAQESNLENAIEAKKSVEQQRLQLIEEHRSHLVGEITKQRIDVVSQQSEVDKLKKILEQKELRSPIDGFVQSLAVNTVGGTVAATQTLAMIVPSSSSLFVEAVVSNDEVGFVKVGQSADIKIDAFPFNKYGVVQGVVTWISPDAEERSNGMLDPTTTQSKPVGSTVVPVKAGLVYKIRLAINQEQTLLKSGLTSASLTPGMTVQANIVTGQRRIIDFFLAPIAQSLDESLKIR
ncbi:HlyD family type I secretion periplasmic adaptor subunit [Denitratisoma sp. agr-D3]